MESNTGKVINLSSLYNSLQTLHDKRKPKGKRYALQPFCWGYFCEIVWRGQASGIANGSSCAGNGSLAAGAETRSMPHHNTLSSHSLADAVDEKNSEQLVRERYRYSGKTGYQVVVAMDGKMIRGTIDLEPGDGLCLLALYLPGEGVTLAQVAIPSRQNEISAAPTLLEYVDLRNKVVIGDAIHTQRRVSIQIGTAGGNYLWTVKANQPELLGDLQGWFDTEVKLIPGMGCPPKDFRSATLTNKGHGRIEVRTLTTSSQLNDFLDWPFLQQVFRLERKVTLPKTGKTHCEVTYGITSLSANNFSEQLTAYQIVLASRWLALSP
jgi:hypothetical protein